ncbi:MAG: Flp pilus assembly complex ATPase component TadA [Desulfobacteraceae bacterium]|nr:Flp pilus assembly complex ATPase component TadA [Desulfobacteraceae bacterium]
MYESFYNLKENPFNLHPDPDYLFMSSGHEDAYSHLIYAIVENKGFVIITGEIGSGKTTLLNYLLKEIPQDITVGLINNTYLSPEEFLRTMCREFELDIDKLEKSAVVSRFHEFLLKEYAEKKRVVLIVDEAQNLTPRTMEAIRMLSNLESEKSHLMQIILVGQPELKYKLQRRDLQQFTQRVTVHCHLDALNHTEVEDYIKFRLSVGGARDPSIFDESAIAAIVKYSRGIPRLINILCDTALVYGFADSKERIDQQTIEDVVKERSSGGIFLTDPKSKETAGSQNKESITVTTGAVSGNGAGQLKSRIDLLEQKISHLDGVCANLNKLLTNLSEKRDEKDAIMVELFKLLKSSLDSRLKVISHISKNQEKKKTLRPN